METQIGEDEYSSGEERSNIRDFFSAIERNDLNTVSEILNNPRYSSFVDLQDTNNDYNTPLHLAIKRRSKQKIDKDTNKKIIVLLISKNANINAKNGKKQTPLDLVNEKTNDPDWQLIKDLLEQAQPSTSRQSQSQPSPAPGRNHPCDAENGSSLSRDSSDVPPAQPSSVAVCDSKRKNVDQFDATPTKRQKTDNGTDEHSPWSPSGSKPFLHGNIYQLQLLMLFVQRGINYYHDFGLATEMPEAMKFDDVVFKYKVLAKAVKFTWRFLQAKHKKNKEKNKITVNDLTTSKDDGDFSLQKYFVSFYKIENDQEFRASVLEDFTICTNTDFDFEPKKGEHHGTRVNKAKWKKFFTDQRELTEDKILYFGGQEGKEVRFKSDDKTIAAVSEEIKRALNKNIEIKKALKNSKVIGNKLSDLIAALENFDSNIKDFLKKFRFVINYPNVDELNILIGKEVGKDFNLLNPDLATNSFQKSMLDWFKNWFKRKSDEFLSKNDAKEFFDSIHREIDALITAGFSKAYPDKLRAYELGFKESLQREELTKFLSSANWQTFHISTESTRLSAIKVLESLDRSHKYKNHDSYIFMRLRTILRPETQKYVSNALSLPKKTYDLLVIECQCKDQKKADELSKLSKVLKDDSSKKIILIGQSENALVRKFKILDENRIDDETSFKDLDEDSQKKVLKRKVNFQGKPISLNEVINEGSASKIIDQACLSRLIERERIAIGNEKAFSSIGYVKDYYIPRTFRQKIEDQKGVNINIKKERAFIKPEALGQKVFLIANNPGMGKSTVLTSVVNQMKEEYPASWIVRINLNDYAVDKEVQHSLHNITFKGSETERAIDFVSKMAITANSNDPDIELQRKIFKGGLSKFKNADGQEFKYPYIVLLFDGFDEISPSFNSSTTKLMRALKESGVAQLWVTTRVHEKDHLQKELGTPAYILNSLTEPDQTSFLSKFWKWNLKFYKEAYSETIYERTCREIIKHLDEIKLPNEWFAEELTIDISNIRNKYPDEAVDKLEDLRKDIDKELDFFYYAEGLLGQWNKSVRVEDKEFNVVPLHLRMLAEVVFENKFQLPQNFGLKDLYDEFKKIKFDIFRKEKATGSDNVANDGSIEARISASCRVHRELSVKLIFPKEQSLPGLNELERFNEDYGKDIKGREELARIGLLSLKEDQLEFIHRSFAEYFLSEYLVKNSGEEQVQKLLMKRIFIEKGFELIRKFFNGALEKAGTNIKLTEAVKKSMNKVSAKTGHGRTLLHVMASEGLSGICEFLFKNIQDNAELLEELLIKRDGTQCTAIHLAIWGNHVEIVKQLLHNGIKLDLETFKNEILKVRRGEGTSLNLAAERGYNGIVQLVLDFVKDRLVTGFLKEFVLETDGYGETALHHACDNGHTEVVKTLLNFIEEHLGEKTLRELVLKPNVFNVPYPGMDPNNYKVHRGPQTALQRAAQNGFGETVRIFSNSISNYPDILMELVLKTDFYGATASLLKAVYGHLLEHINDPEAIEDLAILSVYGYAYRDPKEIVDKLLDVIDEESEIHEKLLFIKNHLEEVKEKRESLSKAVVSRNEDGVQKILDESRDYIKELALATRNDKGTALHEAAELNQGEILVKILKSIDNYPRVTEALVLKVYGSERETALHRAAKSDDHQTVLKLLNFLKDHLGKELLKSALLKPKVTGTTAIYAAHYTENGREYWRTRLQSLQMCSLENGQTVKVFLEFVLEHSPEILEKQVKEIGGMQKILDWAKKNDYLDLERRLLASMDSLEKTKLALRKAAKDGNGTDLRELLNDLKGDIPTLEECLLRANDEETLLNLCTGEATRTLLECVKDNIQDNTLKKLVLASEDVLDTDFLSWVKYNFEENHPGTLKKLLLKDSFMGKTALSFAVWDSKFHAVELLNWMKGNIDVETFKEMMLATDYEKRNVLHSSIFDSELMDKSRFVQELLEALENHPETLQAMLLKTDRYGETALDLAIGRLDPYECQIKPDIKKQLQFTIDLYKTHYNKIIASLLDPKINIANFSDKQLDWLDKYVKSNHYAEWNKQEILVKLGEILTSR